MADTFKIKRKVVVETIVEEEVTYNKYIAFKIKQLRKERKLTQEEFAQLIGISRVSVVNIEAARQAIPMKNLYLICKALNVKSNKILPF